MPLTMGFPPPARAVGCGSFAAVRTRTALRRPRRAAIAAAALLAAGALAGCGSGPRQDENEPEGNFPVELSQASFPRAQGLGQTAPFSLAVTNIGDETIPDVALTVDGFANPDAVPGSADPARPLWIVNAGPLGATTAYVNTWTLGALRPGQTRRFTWSVTAAVPGTHTVSYRAGAGLHGKAVAVADGGGVPSGSVTVRVTRRPRETTVDPETNELVVGESRGAAG